MFRFSPRLYAAVHSHIVYNYLITLRKVLFRFICVNLFEKMTRTMLSSTTNDKKIFDNNMYQLRVHNIFIYLLLFIARTAILHKNFTNFPRVTTLVRTDHYN